MSLSTVFLGVPTLDSLQAVGTSPPQKKNTVGIMTPWTVARSFEENWPKSRQLKLRPSGTPRSNLTWESIEKECKALFQAGFAVVSSPGFQKMSEK